MQKLIEVKAAKEFADTFYAHDPILKYAAKSLLDNVPAADVTVITSAEKQAIFRLGQMDMRDSMADMLRDVAKRSKGIVKADFMAAADLVTEREIP